MPKFVVDCVERDSAVPYRIVVEARSEEEAVKIAADDHICSKAHPFEDRDSEEVRELRAIRKSLAALPDPATLRAIIRGSVFRACIQFAGLVIAVVLITWIVLNIINAPMPLTVNR